MPRKRRWPKRRRQLPQGLQQITLAERCHWSADGPLLDSDLEGCQPPEGYHGWPDWGTWMLFYGAIRDELFAARAWLRDTSVADRLYLAWRDGQEPDELRAVVRAEHAAHDPRLSIEARRAA